LLAIAGGTRELQSFSGDSILFLVLVAPLISLEIAAESAGDAMLGRLAFFTIIIVCIAASAALVSSVSISGSVRDLLQKASNLEEYERDIRKKWGQDVI
jgi:hypothetical protein